MPFTAVSETVTRLLYLQIRSTFEYWSYLWRKPITRNLMVYSL